MSATFASNVLTMENRLLSTRMNTTDVRRDDRLVRSLGNYLGAGPITSVTTCSAPSSARCIDRAFETRTPSTSMDATPLLMLAGFCTVMA